MKYGLAPVSRPAERSYHPEVRHTGGPHEHDPHHWLLFRLWAGDCAPVPRPRLAGRRHDAHASGGPTPGSDRLTVLPLDVTDAGSIARAVAEAGPLDVLVNNAGVGLLNALEGLSMGSAREVFETNTLGTIAMTQAVLPQFRNEVRG